MKVFARNTLLTLYAFKTVVGLTYGIFVLVASR